MHVSQNRTVGEFLPENSMDGLVGFLIHVGWRFIVNDDLGIGSVKPWEERDNSH